MLEGAETANERSPAASQTPAAARPCLLAVDDHPANLLLLTKLLKSLDVDVVTVESGTAAVEAARQREFAAILLDVQMPDMDGFETAQKLRECTSTVPTPIIFITAADRAPKTALKGYASGAIDFLYKPIDRVLLLSKVNVLLDLYRHRQQLAGMTRTLSCMNRQMSQLLQAVGDGILGIAANGRIAFANPAACTLIRVEAAQLVGRTLQEVTGSNLLETAVRPAGAEPACRSETLFRDTSGREIAVEYVLSAANAKSCEEAAWVLVFRDISERQQALARLREQADRDALTGLANRACFDRTLAGLLAGSDAPSRRCGVLFIDLDGFKQVNDRYGHAFGDELLVTIARRLQKLLPRDHLCARLGGDEFAVLLPDGADPDRALELGRALISAIGEPHWYDGQRLQVGASIGIALYPDHGVALPSLLHAADLAMYAAKARHAAGVVLAAPVRH